MNDYSAYTFGKRDAEIATRRNAGGSLRAIGREYNISGERVRQILLKRFGMNGDNARHVFAAKARAAVLEYQTSDGPVYAVAENNGISPSALSAALRAGGVSVDLSRRTSDHWNRLPQDNRESLANMYAGGMSFTQILYHTGHSNRTVKNCMVEFGVTSRSSGCRGKKRPWTAAETTKMIALRNTGLSQHAIAQQMGRSQTSICEHLRRAAA